MKKSRITQKRIKELLNYDPETGIFKWKILARSDIHPGSIAGCEDKNGYSVIMIDGKNYFAHRLAWLYTHGYFPETQIDHVNRNRSDNRISNLRVVTQMCNSRNCGNWSNNTSGVKGVSFHKINKTWAANITVNKKQINLGLYKSFHNAVCARLAAEQALDWSGCDSSSPAYKYVSENILNKFVIAG